MEDEFKREVAGALKQTIDAHGPIDDDTISSASKRVARSIREAIKRERDRHMEALDEEWMAAHGWVRDKKSEETL